MAQIQKGVTFNTYPGTNSQITASLINEHVDNAELLNGAISEQTETASALSSDAMLISTGGNLRKITVQNLTSTAIPKATTDQLGVMKAGTGLTALNGVVSVIPVVDAANGTSGSAKIILNSTLAENNLTVELQNITGLTFAIGVNYTITIAPGSAALGTNPNQYAFIFGAIQVTGVTSSSVIGTIPNIPNSVEALNVSGIYIELLGTAGIVTPSTGNGISVSQETVGTGTQPVMKLVPATKASIGGVVVGNNLDISTRGIISLNPVSATIKAFASFSGLYADSTSKSCTYSRAPNGIVTVTATAHGFKVGHKVYLNFTTGTTPPADQVYDIIAPVAGNTFTVNATTYPSVTTGNCNYRTCLIYKNLNLNSIILHGIGTALGSYSFNFEYAQPDVFYVPQISASSYGFSSPAILYPWTIGYDVYVDGVVKTDVRTNLAFSALSYSDLGAYEPMGKYSGLVVHAHNS
jgi:hypothetical protein